MAEERRRRSTFVGPGGGDMHRGKSVMEDGSIDGAGLAVELRWFLRFNFCSRRWFRRSFT
jgi:hypothetical protein